MLQNTSFKTVSSPSHQHPRTPSCEHFNMGPYLSFRTMLEDCWKIILWCVVQAFIFRVVGSISKA